MGRFQHPGVEVISVLLGTLRGYLSHSPAIVAQTTQADHFHWECPQIIKRDGSPVPLLAPLPLDGQARRIANLDPDRARPRSIGAVDLLGDDALGAKPASVGENDRPIFRDVLVQHRRRS
jgi:hypothetical protein